MSKQKENSIAGEEQYRIPRREVLRMLAGGVFLMSGGAILTGCGGGGSSSGGGSSTSGNAQFIAYTGSVAHPSIKASNDLTSHDTTSVTRLATLRNIGGKNAVYWGTKDTQGYPVAILQAVVWENDPAKAHRTWYDGQGRPIRARSEDTGIYVTLTWDSTNTLCAVQYYDIQNKFIGGSILKGQGKSYTINPLTSAALASIRGGQREDLALRQIPSANSSFSLSQYLQRFVALDSIPKFQSETAPFLPAFVAGVAAGVAATLWLGAAVNPVTILIASGLTVAMLNASDCVEGFQVQAKNDPSSVDVSASDSETAGDTGAPSLGEAPPPDTPTTPDPLVEKVVITSTITEVKPGRTIQLTAAVKAGAQGQFDLPGTFTWASSDTSVATIDKNTGILTGIAPGFASITATEKTLLKQSQPVTVRVNELSANITVNLNVSETGSPGWSGSGKFSAQDINVANFGSGHLQIAGPTNYTGNFSGGALPPDGPVQRTESGSSFSADLYYLEAAHTYQIMIVWENNFTNVAPKSTESGSVPHQITLSGIQASYPPKPGDVLMGLYSTPDEYGMSEAKYTVRIGFS